ncbi:MAG TPA: cupin domain-containing protein [Aggregatilinea sp.]|uniref:cupin domain-containing protein n=1 Tax=Aggregatilinea sp. TaxID=2806333 RepID=UPI002BE5ACB4|nr:cupin domain-containing protein [Aggregatilinea sp.]HML24308.1 cupin domain-containing protein [Aggregatilinea sp.]
MAQSTLNVGPRIRAIREQRKLSLRALAERCDLSINAISLIERGENSPTVSSLHTLANALGVKITDFFEETHEQAIVFVPHGQRLGTQGNGLVMESLGLGLHNQQLEPFLVTVEPRAGGASQPISHPGQEFVYCLSGAVEYHVGSQTYAMQPGDSLLFDATQPHYFCNLGEIAAELLLVFQGFEGGILARNRHLET